MLAETEAGDFGLTTTPRKDNIWYYYLDIIYISNLVIVDHYIDQWCPAMTPSPNC